MIGYYATCGCSVFLDRFSRIAKTISAIQWFRALVSKEETPETRGNRGEQNVKMLRILVVEDRALVRHGLARIMSFSSRARVF